MDEIVTNVHNYIPTPYEKKLLEALLIPENQLLNISELCELLGMSRHVYYDAIKKPGFLEIQRQMSMDIMKANVNKVVAATIKYALECPNNHSDRKILLTMAGIYDDKQKVEMSGAIQNNNINVNMANLSIEELREIIAKTKR